MLPPPKISRRFPTMSTLVLYDDEHIPILLTRDPKIIAKFMHLILILMRIETQEAKKIHPENDPPLKLVKPPLSIAGLPSAGTK